MSVQSHHRFFRKAFGLSDLRWDNFDIVKWSRRPSHRSQSRKVGPVPPQAGRRPTFPCAWEEMVCLSAVADSAGLVDSLRNRPVPSCPVPLPDKIVLNRRPQS
jgi:hypothetical protein